MVCFRHDETLPLASTGAGRSGTTVMDGDTANDNQIMDPAAAATLLDANICIACIAGIVDTIRGSGMTNLARATQKSALWYRPAFYSGCFGASRMRERGIAPKDHTWPKWEVTPTYMSRCKLNVCQGLRQRKLSVSRKSPAWAGRRLLFGSRNGADIVNPMLCRAKPQLQLRN